MIIAFHRCRHCEVWQLPSQMIVPDIDGALCVACAETVEPRSPPAPVSSCNSTDRCSMAENEVALPIRKCRMCGCTETTACGGPNGNCFWVGDDLCSACDDPFDSYDPPETEDDTDAFECAGYYIDGEFYCPIAGTEECDWECDN